MRISALGVESVRKGADLKIIVSDVEYASAHVLQMQLNLLNCKDLYE